MAPAATGEFSWLLSGVTLATKMIQAKIRQAGLLDVLGAHGKTNVQGEEQQKLDVFANTALLHQPRLARKRGVIWFPKKTRNRRRCTVASPGAKYAVVFDPLDGSSNIDVNASVGTIFSIFRVTTPTRRPRRKPSCSRAGNRWRPGTSFTAHRRSSSTRPSEAASTCSRSIPPSAPTSSRQENVRMPERGPYYSVNEAYVDIFPPNTSDTSKRCAVRSTACVTSVRSSADFHRTLLKGGVFLYPPTQKVAGRKTSAHV